MRHTPISLRRRHLMIAGVAGMAVPGILFAARSSGMPEPVSAAASAEKLIVSGRILRADGKPLAGAKIDALHSPANGSTSATTDADGRFMFTTLAPAAHSPHIHYQVSHAEHGTLTRQLHLGRMPGIAGENVAQLQRNGENVAQLQRDGENVAQLQRDEAGIWRAAFGLTLA